MRRVLLVDPDPVALARLHQTLCTLRPQWQTAAAGTAAVALSILGQARFDAIVCAIGTPVLDGPQLLTQVRERHPNVVRLCLSDSIDDDAFLRAMPVTHQFLGKPCNVDALSDTLERICSLRDILQQPAIHELIGHLKALPATRATFQALSEAMARPNTHAADIAQIVSADTALSVKVLQMANSAFYRRGAPVTSIQAAITYAGMEMIKSLALSACVFSALDASPAAAKRLQDIQGRSLRRAHFARMLLRESRHADEAFTAALLLDIGQAVLALSAPDKFEQMIELARCTGRAWHEAEPEVFGAAHPEVGAYLLGLWGLPLGLIEAVAYHHAPSRVQHANTHVLAAVHVADAVIDATADRPARLLDRLDADFVARTGVSRCLTAWNIHIDGEDDEPAQSLEAG
ncbi:MAG TPA: HDOD domain-containing protein [Steroidobacteraceae bacterium]|jgi:HD-like signal output (HDOD) protein